MRSSRVNKKGPFAVNEKFLVGAGVVCGAAIVAFAQLSGHRVASDVSYNDVPLMSKVAKAPLIVTGTVLDISPTRWNQDDGAFWEDTAVDALGVQTVDSGVPYHTVTIRVDETLADSLGFTAGSGGKLTLTVVGMREDQVAGRHPDSADGADGVDGADGTGVLALASDSVSANVGERVIAFVHPGQLAWRGGPMRSILAPMGSPGTTVLSEAVLDSGAFVEAPTFGALVAKVEAGRGAAEDR
ncbi:MAG: hypothetical protein ABI780_09535 [Ardenticatenales bacterium]